MKKRSLLYIATTLILSLFLGSCSTVYLDADTTSDINPNLQGTPSSIMIYVFQLKDKLAFDSANFSQINSENGLKGSVISRETYVLQPGEQKEIYISTDEDAKYIGIAAGYRNINLDWKQIVPVESHWLPKTYKLKLTSYGVKLKE
ncbi:type VI secretion system lipoprotein TssJ [Francisella philomiragia]|uniref:Type VI secretion lipofamily protein n=1 Tax=Francisella philomiragia TaxID=28110 RepID=A0A0B6D3F2_9GAMM|nr:type VI secretion system lipoprotein TssJ [Francisella philomiragia]AJI53381.1 type VI secretion lipofamily protein [Francisella philomiragia]